jgi:hypothetical protein
VYVLGPLLKLLYPIVWFVNLFVSAILWMLRVKPGDIVESPTLSRPGDYYEKEGGAWAGEVGPFFIEGADILSLPVAPAITGGDFTSDVLFYSRRIGKRPSYQPDLADGESAIERTARSLARQLVARRNAVGAELAQFDQRQRAAARYDVPTDDGGGGALGNTTA